MELRGRRILESCGALWYSVEGNLYMSLPYQLPLNPDPEDLNQMLRKVHAVGARFPSLAHPGLPSGLYVCRSKSYRLASLPRSLRPKVRRGLQRCEFRRIEQSELYAQGLALNLDTMTRQHRSDPEFADPLRWRRLVDAIALCPAVFPMGAFMHGHLAAYAITCREDGWLHVLHRMSRTDDLPHRPNHALDFVLTQQIATDPTLKAISMGFYPLARNTGLHEYKRHLGYELLPLNTVIWLHPALRPLLTSVACRWLARGLSEVWPASPRLRLATTVLEGARVSDIGSPPPLRRRP
jgi:hypothetical protein